MMESGQSDSISSRPPMRHVARIGKTKAARGRKNPSAAVVRSKARHARNVAAGAGADFLSDA
jgi:hypothetical protein